MFIVFGLFLVGFVVFACWIAGYCFEIVKRVMAGDRKLPPPHRNEVRRGFRLFCYSLWFWAPGIFAFICVCLLFDGIRSEFTDRASILVLQSTVAIAPVIFCGNLVGIARYAVYGERSLIYRRLENIRLALSSFRATLALTLSLIVATVFTANVKQWFAELIYSLQISDPEAEAALASFVFFFTVLCFSIACSHLIAAYAKRTGFCDNLNHSARHG